MHFIKTTLFCLLAIAISSPAMLAQIDLNNERFAFEPEVVYDASIPSPEDVLGYPLGSKFSIYADIVDYFKKLAESSPRISIHTYGKTYENRKLYYLVISSEENQSRIEEIRTNNLKLADPVNTPAGEAAAIMANHPVVVSYSYNIHGNEASSSEAAMQVAYRLAASNDETAKNILDNSVFVMMPCINPDGRDRYVYWVNSVQRDVIASGPRDLEHYAPWPNGRTNHYWFDLNRDWIWGIHPESRGHTGVYQQWMPQVHVDYHEQGYHNNYFTVPGTTPRNLLLPKAYEALADTIGKANIEYLDKHQVNYFTREAFDFFYPGYGSSYPSVMGAIGMLTEQGGIGAGLAVKTNDDYVLTFRQRIFDHYLTSIATLAKSAEQRKIFLDYTWSANNPQNSKSKTKAYFFPDEPRGYLYEVLEILLRQGVSIERAEADFRVPMAKPYHSRNGKDKSFPKGTFIVKTDQARHLFINSVLSPEMAIEDSVMYDMSTWAAPLAYNLEAFYAETMPTVKTSSVKELPAMDGKVVNPQAGYAYTIDWSQNNAPKALAMLWEKGYRVRSAREAFSTRQKSWSPGTLVILLGRNLHKKEKIHEDMEAIAKAAKVIIDGHHTGRMHKGYDLASAKNVPIKQRKVALLVERPFSTYTCGQIYFLFDQITGLPVDRLRTSILKETAIPDFGARYGKASLHDYEVLILAGGGNNLKKLFGKEQLKSLEEWIKAGGTLIATESAAEFFTVKKSKLTKVELLEMKKDSSEAALYLAYEDRQDYYGKKKIPGSALNAHIDVSNPLGFGVKPEIYSLKFGTNALKPNPDFQTVGYYQKDPEKLLASGYASKENLEHLAGKTFAGVQSLGSGKIIFLLDNTQYRMFWRGPSRMMQNAVMLVK